MTHRPIVYSGLQTKNDITGE